MKYRWADGAGKRAGRGVTAQVAGREIARIEARDGHVTSESLVDASRPDDAPLHPAFEWNDARAAERYRVHQASTLIRAVVTVETKEASEHKSWVLTTVEEAPKPVYVSAARVVESPSMFADAIGRLNRNLEVAKRGVAELTALATQEGSEPERMARIALAAQALEAAASAVSSLH